MAADGVKSALGEAVADHRARELQPQRDLFDALGARTELDRAVEAANGNALILDEAWHQAEAEREREATAAPGPRPPGRPKGARNLRTEEAAIYYKRRHGDPLEQAVKIGAMPILAAGVLEGLAQRLGCTKLEAAKWWSSNNQAVMGFVTPKLGQIEIKPAGSPGSTEAMTWNTWDYQIIDGELVDNSISEQRAIAAREIAAEIETAPEEASEQ